MSIGTVLFIVVIAAGVTYFVLLFANGDGPASMWRLGRVSAFLGLGLGAALAWLLEALTVGRGVVSTYLAAVAIAALLIAIILRKR
jgi:hypothetical protein